MSNTIAGYDYPPPSKADFLDALSRVVGPGESGRAWEHACSIANVSPTSPLPTEDDLVNVAQALIQMSGLHGVVGNSMYVRLITYAALSKQRSPAHSGGGHD